MVLHEYAELLNNSVFTEGMSVDVYKIEMGPTCRQYAFSEFLLYTLFNSFGDMILQRPSQGR
jgi:hypothetical protein